MRRHHSARVYRNRPPETKNRTPTPVKNIDLIPVYQKPEIPDMIVIIAFFNPCKSIRLIQNCLYILGLLQSASIPTCVYELTHPETPPVLHNQNLVCYRNYTTDSVLFHKENLMNLAIKELRNEYNKFVLLDSDVIFANKNWYNEVSNLLNEFDILQPFDLALWLNYNMTLSGFQVMSFCFVHSNKLNKPSHHGFCWALTLEGYDKLGGLPEDYPLGGNDTILANRARDINLSYLSGRIFHLHHGSLKNKQYSSRHQALHDCLKKLKLSIKDCTIQRDDGIREWVQPHTSTFNTLCMTYLLNRKDDDI